MKTNLAGEPCRRFASPPLPAGLRCVTKALLVCAAMSASAWAAEPVAAREVEVQGVKLHYLTSGHGAPLLLLHGYAETSLMMEPLMPSLADRFTVIAPDLPGIGAKPSLEPDSNVRACSGQFAEPTRSSPSAATVSAASSKTTGLTAGRPFDLHRFVAHPEVTLP
jgi:hypothetical protein